MKRTHKNLGIAPLVAGLLLACSSGSGDGGPGDPQPGNAYLTIVGDKNVFVESGASTQLVVKYHDGNGDPLAGEVTFRIEGNPAGARLLQASGITDNEGLVRVGLESAPDTEAAFSVVAEAAHATPVDWRIAVSRGEPPLPPLNPEGQYKLDSQFDLVSGLPGDVGNVVNTILDATDGPNDPATWLIDQLVDSIDSSTVRSIVNSLRPGLDAFVNDQLRGYAPDFVNQLIDIANDFGEVSRRFGLVSELKVVPGGVEQDGYVATHTATGVFFTVNGARYDYTVEELDLGVIKAENLAITIQNNTTMLVGDHALPVSYGRMLLFALNNVIIPLVDPFSGSLEEFFLNNVDCYNIGWDIYDYVNWGSPGLYEAACQTALATGAAIIEDQILELDDTASALKIHGDARAQDSNSDAKIDKLVNGLWEGEFQFGPEKSILSKPAQKFTGQRMGIN